MVTFRLMGIIDLGPVHVRGAIRARYARTIWSDGTLYVVSGTGRQVLETDEPEKPSTPNGYWRATTATGQTVSFTRRGCGTCGSSPYVKAGLGKLSQQAIIDG